MNKIAGIILSVLLGCTVLLAFVWAFFQKSMEQIDVKDAGNSSIYDRHYVLIADKAGSVLWDSIYESAKEEADRQGAYLEYLQPQNDMQLDQEDYLRISIASKVDGIILKPDGSMRTRELVNEAAQQGIPVVTVLEDDSASARISFVGLNGYQLADAYCELLYPELTEGENNIMLLYGAEGWMSGSSLIHTQMVANLDRMKEQNMNINLQSYVIDSTTDFATEEMVRDIFVKNEKLPDIMVCMNEVITECTYQALVDYNKVGEVDIIGFHYSDAILDALKRSALTATIVLDTQEIGRYSIDALAEHADLGYASEYYSVDMDVVTAENEDAYLQEKKAE